MNISISDEAPEWAQIFAKAVGAAMEGLLTRPLPGPFSIAAMPTASKYVGRQVRLSDGAGGIPTATSNGTDWVYPDGTTI